MYQDSASQLYAAYFDQANSLSNKTIIRSEMIKTFCYNLIYVIKSLYVLMMQNTKLIQH